jgi:uncharacterized protein involved in type VI secretion and phage assembly
MGNEPDTYRRHRAPNRLNLCADFWSRCRNAGACFWHKADIPTVAANVRFRGKSGHQDLKASRPLLTLRASKRAAAGGAQSNASSAAHGREVLGQHIDRDLIKTRDTVRLCPERNFSCFSKRLVCRGE